MTTPGPRQSNPVSFGRPRPDGRVEDGLELLGYDAEPRWQDGLPWQRVVESEAKRANAALVVVVGPAVMLVLIHPKPGLDIRRLACRIK